MRRIKFNFPKEKVDRVLIRIRKFGYYVDSEKTNIKTSDPKDQVFYDTITTYNNDNIIKGYLLTGNLKDFPKEKYIVNCAELKAIMEDTTNYC